MSKDFLGALGDQISSQFSLGNNTNNTLDSIDVDSNKTIKYGSLGEFSSHFDQSSERRYVEEGYLRTDPFSTTPKQFEILMQEPSATVLVKKRMFSSVADNFRLDFMDDDEKIYYKSMKILFQNKCNQIAALEKLSKIQKITDSVGSVNEQLMPIIFSLSDSISSGFSSGSNPFGAASTLQGPASKLTNTIDTLRRLYGFNVTNKTTSWITDDTNLFQSQFGQGTGVIEVTNFTSLRTTTSTNMDGGNFSIEISDPYEAMVITEWDIERAISDATNLFYNSKTYQFAKESSSKLINDLTIRLNNARAERKASAISIKLNPDTLLGKRVVAIIDRLGIELPFNYDSTSAASIFSGGAFGGGAKVPPEYLYGGEIAGNDGLSEKRVKFPGSDIKRITSDSEVSLFSKLISTINSKLSQDANAQGAFTFHNKKTNYARRKLRFNFSGKLIIQPMDTVHIFMASKSRFDTKLLSGLQSMFSGVGMLQNLNNTLTGLKTSIDTLFNPSGSVPIQIEKAAFVGADFPNSLWSMIRGQFVSEKEGSHVFAGVVETASGTATPGKFSVSIAGKDNSYYFDQGKINFKPGADQYNGVIYDPLTPFKSNFDTVFNNRGDLPELLDQNKYLLGSKDSTGQLRKGLVKSKLGRYAGELVDEKHIINDRNIDPVTGRITNVFYAPDGLAYKWKEGIGVFTQTGSASDLDNAGKTGEQNPAREPFAGQDVMNVLSLLITGQVYNFSNYYQSMQDINSGFADQIKNQLSTNNALWGNFIPFKNLVMDENSHVLAITVQNSIMASNSKLNNNLAKLAEINKRASFKGAINIFSSESSNKDDQADFEELKAEADVLTKQIRFYIDSITAANVAFHMQGGDAESSFDSTEFTDPSNKNKAVSDAAIRRLTRRQLNFLTRRMSYNIRANDDKNLFIVDDTYDKDQDILAFEKALTKLEMFNSDFTSTKEKIKGVAQLLNLEVFCDTQGHIRVRNPQYNRMPSSIFYRMMHLKETMGIQVFPQFLNDLFKNKLDSIKNKLEILEDQIRLDCAVLDYNTDATATKFIAANNTGSNFSFISSEGTEANYYQDGGTIIDIASLINAANPDNRKGKSGIESVIAYAKIESANMATKDIFTNTQKYNVILTELEKQKQSANGTNVLPTPAYLYKNPKVDNLVKRIQTKSGVKINKRDYLVETTESGIVVEKPGANTMVDIFNTVNKLSEKIRDRQNVLKTFFNTIKNAREYQSLDNEKSLSNEMITPGVYGKSSIPEVFEHMIEDETYDDLGVGSGTRYIIKRSQITSMTISENPPPATIIEVSGYLDQYNTAPGADIGTISSTGNPFVKASAIDYDMWRNYGFRQVAQIITPFLNDSDSQCAPYAAMLLSRNRKDILKGSITISGNEFMQPGEVVYVEDRGLLFYVTSVSQSFTSGSSFQTTLQLSYGHTPGEYIPTPMDFMGKMIYNNKDIGNMSVERQNSSNDDANIGVLQLIKNQDSDNGVASSLGLNQKDGAPLSSFAAANSKTLNYIIYSTAYLLNKNQNKDKIARIELRTYHDDISKTDPDVAKFAQSIKDILTNPEMKGLNAVITTKQGTSKSIAKTFIKDPDMTSVNLDNINDKRSPSQKAIDAARNNVSNNISSFKKTAKTLGGSVANVGSAAANVISKSEDEDAADAAIKEFKIQQDYIRYALFSSIVDCWITIEDASNAAPNAESC